MSVRYLFRFAFIGLYFPIIFSCSNNTDKETEKQPLIQFESLESSNTGIDFSNNLDLNKIKSPFEYINVYNGGGVATGDINNDGLPDLFFTGNLEDNRLYLNQGDFKFKDITQSAGVAVPDSWCTGVTMTDVNQDGFLDIYVCRSYYDEPNRRENQLFINNGDLTFTEKAKEYGLNDSNYSILATFLDFNKDGLPDLYVGNHPLNRMKPLVFHKENWDNPLPEFTDKLFLNNGDNTFTDVTKSAGIFNYCWTLGCMVADFNQDDWPDIYLAVDHSEPDRYYLNNQDGTFSEVSNQNMPHISYSSMGTDGGDINNDGLIDLAIVEMLAADNFREKTKMASMNPEKFWTFVNVGYHYQYMRNMLHLNMGNGEFSDIAQMAGVQRTDWSWSSLLADFDNDGWKDFYVSNGYYREYLDKDFFNGFKKNLEKAKTEGRENDRISIISNMGFTAPSSKVENNFFKNNGDLTFSDAGKEFGLNHLGFSNGAAYADFDNDGDLDLAVSNIDEPASIYKNNEQENGGSNYLRLKFAKAKNIQPIGTKVTLYSASGLQYQEFVYARGYQSSTEGAIHFGLGKDKIVDKLVIKWLNGKEEVLENIKVNQILTIAPENAKTAAIANQADKPAQFQEVTTALNASFQHEEIYFDDYSKQILLPHQLTQLGPFISTGDVNGDQLEDFYIGNGSGKAGVLFTQNASGKFTAQKNAAFEKDKDYEDMGNALFDADGDGDLDLYVVSGSYEFDKNDPKQQDRLYINDGKGNFSKKSNALPAMLSSGSCVKPYDFDGDGDLDLFVAGRQVPGKYPSTPSSALLENDKGKFKNITQEKAPDLEFAGMITDAVWTDFDGDQQTDLIVVGEWMPITFFKNVNGQLQKSDKNAPANSSGWWNKIAAADLDKDGDVDYVLGNLGRNYKYQASIDKPFHVYGNDFDESGTYDIALGYFLENDVLYPVRGRQCSSEQVPSIAEKFPSYNDFGKASIFDVYGEGLEDALHLEVNNFHSGVLMNEGSGQFSFQSLPNEAQIAPINAIVIEDLDEDGHLDLVVGGNLFLSEVETGRADGGKGLFLKGDGKGNFKPIMPSLSGLWIKNDVKDIQAIKNSQGKSLFIIGNNNAAMQIIEWQGKTENDLIGMTK